MFADVPFRQSGHKEWSLLSELDQWKKVINKYVHR